MADVITIVKEYPNGDKLVSHSEWPVVIENDDGIRPAGLPDRCFYCHARIGEPHGEQCTVVTKLTEYNVHVGKEAYDDLSGEIIGTFVSVDPYWWEEGNAEFHKNGSTWCAGNADDLIKWLDTPKSKEWQKKIEELDYEHSCSCHLLAFSVKKDVHPGPLTLLNALELPNGESS